MPKNVLLATLSSEQRRTKKVQDWKVRRVLRMLQVRQQARTLSEDQRILFWTSVNLLERQKIETIECELQIQEDLVSKRRAEEECKNEKQRMVIVEQERLRAERVAEKRLSPEEYAERARLRFEKAMAEERCTKQLQKECENEAIDVFKRARQIEDVKSRIRAAHFRQSQMPITMHIPASKVHRESMVPREGIPVSTPYLSKIPTMVSPISTTIDSLISKEAPGKRVLDAAKPGDYSPGSLTKKVQIHPREIIVKPRKLVLPATALKAKPTSENIRKPSPSVESVISLDKENIEPVITPEESSDKTVRYSPEFADIATSAQSSLILSTRDSIQSQDSMTLCTNLRLRARELSPPKQLPVPFMQSSMQQRSGHRIPAQPLPDVVGDRKNVGSPKKQLIHQRSRPLQRNIQQLEQENISELLKEMASIGINVRAKETDTFEWSVSSGPISTPDTGRIGSNESWLSYQTLSQNSSLLDNLSTVESGTLYSSSLASSGALGLSSTVGNSSSISSGNLEGMVSDYTIESPIINR